MAITQPTDVAMMATQRTVKPVAGGDVERLRKVAEDFEAVFLSQMLKPMFANLGAEKPFGGGSGEDMWRSLQVDEFGKAISRKGGIGIADNIFREMLKLQEAQ
jgi:Rod binding domain-containing protein